MPAFRLDKMQIIRDGNKINVEHPLVAVSEEELGSENYQMIINPDILTGGKKMVIKVAVPHQFKLKVIPDFRSLFFGQKTFII